MALLSWVVAKPHFMKANARAIHYVLRERRDARAGPGSVGIGSGHDGDGSMRNPNAALSMNSTGMHASVPCLQASLSTKNQWVTAHMK